MGNGREVKRRKKRRVGGSKGRKAGRQTGRKEEKEGGRSGARSGAGRPRPHGSDLEVLRRDHEHQLEGRALAEGHAHFPLLVAPRAVLLRVQDHLIPAIKAGIEVEGDVCPLALPHLEVHEEPGGTRRAVPLAALQGAVSHRYPVAYSLSL